MTTSDQYQKEAEECFDRAIWYAAEKQCYIDGYIAGRTKSEATLKEIESLLVDIDEAGDAIKEPIRPKLEAIFKVVYLALHPLEPLPEPPTQ